MAWHKFRKLILAYRLLIFAFYFSSKTKLVGAGAAQASRVAIHTAQRLGYPSGPSGVGQSLQKRKRGEWNKRGTFVEQDP